MIINKNNIYLSTVATVIKHNNKFLLVEEYKEDYKQFSPDGLLYNQPAGCLELGETLVEAAKREVLEETAWEIKIDAVIGIYHWLANKDSCMINRTCFSGSLIQYRQDQLIDVEIKNVIWMYYEEIILLNDKMSSPMVIKCIEDYINGKSYPLNLLSYV